LIKQKRDASKSLKARYEAENENQKVSEHAKLLA
jgi:hypothetical protein